MGSFVLADGPLAKTVALGVFSSFSAAERVVQTVSVAELARLVIYSPSQADVTTYLRLKGAETGKIRVLQASGAYAAPCPPKALFRRLG